MALGLSSPCVGGRSSIEPATPDFNVTRLPRLVRSCQTPLAPRTNAEVSATGCQFAGNSAFAASTLSSGIHGPRYRSPESAGSAQGRRTIVTLRSDLIGGRRPTFSSSDILTLMDIAARTMEGNARLRRRSIAITWLPISIGRSGTKKIASKSAIPPPIRSMPGRRPRDAIILRRSVDELRAHLANT